MSGSNVISCPPREDLEEIAAGACGNLARVRHVQTCAVCQATLRRIEEDNRLIASCLDAEPSLSTSTATGPAGYQVLGEISRGGQGVVFDALQRSTGRRVALKRLAAGRLSTSAQRRRFEREIELIASLRHPNIVALYEAGATDDGEAYFAMEFVDGLPLDRFLAERVRAGGASVAAILALFVRVCSAVSHAHQRGVIHRDLKPGNILVDREGEPRVLDFGLARSIDDGASHSAHDSAFAGTLAYASPEQFAGGADAVVVRSDVYSLGVVLHEALVGSTPFGDCASLDELVRRKSEPPAVRLRSVNPAIDADTETIVLKALAVDPQRRYQSMAELQEDLERRLAGRPIVARQDNVAYVLSKLALRHRVAVAIGAAVVVAMGVLVAALMLSQAARERQRGKAVDTLHAFREALASASPLDGDGGGASLTAFLGDVDANVRGHLKDQPDAAAAIFNTLGEISLAAADYDAAQRRFEEALALGRRHHDGPHETVAESIHHLGRVAFFRGQFVTAAEFYRQALAMRRDVLGADHPDVANTMGHLGSTLRRLDDLDAAERLFRESLAIRLGNPRSTIEEVAAGWNNLGSLLLDAGRVEEATDACVRALGLIETAVGSNDWRTAQALRNRAACLLRADDVAGASADLARATAIWSALVSDDHPSLASTRHELAGVRLRLGDLPEAEALCRRALEAHEGRLGPAHPKVVEGLELLAAILRAPGRIEGAAAPRSSPTEDSP